MLHIRSSHQAKLCDGISRRAFLRIGALTVGGLTLPDLLRLRSQAAGRQQGRAVIMVYLQGGPSHIDTYDMKPDAPLEFRGEYKPIQTNVPGISVFEHLIM